MPDTPLNPDAFDAAWEALYEAFSGRIGDLNGNDCERMAETAIQAYLAAALPEVTEREQLTALHDKIVLEDRRGTIWQKINGNWYTPGSKHDYSDQSVTLPARVLYRPEVKP